MLKLYQPHLSRLDRKPLVRFSNTEACTAVAIANPHPPFFLWKAFKRRCSSPEDSFSPSVTTASPQIVPWPVDHPPWLPLRTNDGPRTPYMVPQQTYLDTLNLPASQGTPRLRPAADHPPTPFNHDHTCTQIRVQKRLPDELSTQDSAPTRPRSREAPRTPQIPVPQLSTNDSQPPLTPVYRSSHLQPPIYVPSPASPPKDLPRGPANGGKSSPPPGSPNLRSPGPSPLPRSTPMSPLSSELQEKLSGILERPASAPPNVRDNASAPAAPSPRKARPLQPYASASSPAKALGLGLLPSESPVPTPTSAFTPAGSGSPPRKLSPLSFDREHASSYPEFTFPPQDSNTPAGTPSGYSGSRLSSPKDMNGAHTPRTPEFTFSRHNTPARSPKDLPDTRLPLQAYRDHATQCCFTLPISVEGNRGGPTGALQCTVQGEAKIRLILRSCPWASTCTWAANSLAKFSRVVTACVTPCTWKWGIGNKVAASSRFDPKMAFDNAHDFKIDTANMGTTNNGPLMFWNNTYHPGSVHNHAVVTSGTPTTFYMGGAAPPPPPPRIQERDRSDYSWDNRSEFTDSSSRGRPPPPQQTLYDSPSPALGTPRGPGSPPSESISSYQPQHYSRSSEASPQPQHADASNSDRGYEPPQVVSTGRPSEARLASPEGEIIPERATESPPPRENAHPAGAASASSSVHSAGEHDHSNPKKKRRFWQKMKVWGSKKGDDR
ncbi:hypothetical protein FA13DRAFT_1715608 [Coprinellus micaceus]|uniref:Uncharacterized protein n=1 Tax=Coprinellus micaceus TaxID=71717 RepID=A0A4Y7SMJ6_COPMI|nr:hypothetical protein FA13DRAFT_1715608 [Coprinellus micaceus]